MASLSLRLPAAAELPVLARSRGRRLGAAGSDAVCLLLVDDRPCSRRSSRQHCSEYKCTHTSVCSTGNIGINSVECLLVYSEARADMPEEDAAKIFLCTSPTTQLDTPTVAYPAVRLVLQPWKPGV